MTDIRNYPYKHTPYEHQYKALELSAEKTNYAYFMEMGTGKSKVLLDNACMLWDEGKITAVIISAPKGAYLNWIYNEIPKHIPDHVQYDMAAWKASMKKPDRVALEHMFQANGKLKILVINIETFSYPKSAGITLIRKFLTAHYAMWCVDESTTIKNPSANRTKLVIDLGRRAKYRRILTGEPITRNPMDIYSQSAFLDPKLLGFSSFYSFRSRYAVVEIAYGKGRRTFKKITSFQRQNELKERIQSFSFRIKKKDCLDLPEKIYHKRFVEMSPAWRKQYDTLKEHSMMELQGEIISTNMVVTKLMRLHQVACGFIPDEEGNIIEIDNGRLDCLMDVLVEETPYKALIWCTYTHNVRQIATAIEKQFGPESFGTMYGATPVDSRKDTVERFQDPEDPLRFIVGHPKTGGYGLTLTEAKTVIYYSNSFDLEIRLQSEDRAHRVGQTDHVNYIDLCCKDTVDEYVTRNLALKKDIIHEVMDKGWKNIFDMV